MRISLNNFSKIIVTVLMFQGYVFAQPLNKTVSFTRQDTLRGTVGEFRTHWDVLHYDITVKPDFDSKTIQGKNKMTFFDNGAKLMQVDLQEPMILDSAISGSASLSFRREGNVYWLMLRDSAAMYKLTPRRNEITFYFHGKPREAITPPWDGGWIWKKDKKGRPWMSIACQGLGASVWYPCKDIQSDEPDEGATLSIITPDSLMAVGNGKLQHQHPIGNGYTQYTWSVKNPINSYNLVPYIGKYVHFGETIKGEKGKLDMDYWVLDYNLDTAKLHFSDATRTIEALEHWFGPFPFYEDGYKLVEAPHLGMEHQSAIAYGNYFLKGYRGRDRSGSGWGLKFDFIIVHESAHEWFANNITTSDIADMWVHESFGNYGETLFTDYFYGTEAGNAYVIGTRKNIQNDIPIIGKYGVNKEGSGDMYDKGGNMLHMIRQVIQNDKKFRKILRGLNKEFYHKIVTTEQVEGYITKKSGIDFTKIFDQYLRTTKIPILEYKMKGPMVTYRYTNAVEGFNLPVRVSFHKDTKVEKWLKPNTEWNSALMGTSFDGTTFKVNDNFYIRSKKAE